MKAEDSFATSKGLLHSWEQRSVQNYQEETMIEGIDSKIHLKKKK